MGTHPNLDRANATWETARQGNYSQGFDDLADDVIAENGPGLPLPSSASLQLPR
jgi:hypothetical protein